jgi:IS5 family transposase
MVERAIGQLSLADSFLAGDETVLDRIAKVLKWQPMKVLLGSRSGSGAGNASYPAEVLLRCLLLGVWHGLSDPALEAQIRDRISFRRFAGFSLSDRTPDHTTLWRFRQELQADGLDERVFEEINRQLEEQQLVLKQGTLIDASLVQARARPPGKSRSEGEPARPSADPDARWGRKGNKTVFGYKMHIGVDEAFTIIRRMDMTDGSCTDTERGDQMICGDEKAAYGDQAYYTHARHAQLVALGIKDRLMRRPNKHHPELPKRQKQRNQLIARVRAGVERVFAEFKERYWMRRMRFFSLSTNRTQMLLAGCAYNLRRAATILVPA